MKLLYKISGFLFVGLGVLGIFLPLLPTTPFLLLALFLFFRSSPESFKWLVDHPVLGKYISAYTSGKSMSTPVRVRIIVSMWVVMLLSIIFFVKLLWVRILLAAIGIAVTIHIWTYHRKQVR